MKSYTTLLAALLLVPSYALADSAADMQKIANFLMGSATFQGDGDFMTVKGTLPRSYVSDANYWGGYVCGVEQKGSCDVTDVPRMEGNNFVLNGGVSLGSALQVERTDATLGTDIYDAAAWQIAVALLTKNKLTDSSAANLAIDNVNQRLGRQDVRATGDNFQYGYQYKIASKQQAYAYRMLGDAYLAQDPLVNSTYANYINFKGSQADKTKLFGKISWADWKPITGENAWAFLIGPLQADYLRYRKRYIPFQRDSIQNAINVLPTIEKMQAGNGGIFYAPGGSEGNEGAITPGEISTENSLSMYAGLKILRTVLQNTALKDPNADQAVIQNSLTKIQTLMTGLESFLQHDVWDQNQQQFLSGGVYANDQWTPNATMRAVDVNTWGIAALSPAVIDQWFGDKSAYNIWHHLKSWGGYCDGAACDASSTIKGVGFSDHDNNQILSGEWTFGAINAVHSLKKHYKNSAVLTAAEQTELQQDESSMQLSVMRLRNDQYQQGHLPDSIDSAYQVSLPKNEFAYLYANKRYHIPFGWYANPIPSTASTSWAVMMYYQFNPFVLGG